MRAVRVMGCCQDKDVDPSKEQAKEARAEEVEEEGGTGPETPGGPREWARGKAKEFGLGVGRR